MDRFFLYILGVLAALLLGVFVYTRTHHPIPPADSPPEMKTDASPTPKPKSVFSYPDAQASVSATPAPLMALQTAPAAPQSSPLIASSAPTPMPWSPPNPGTVVTVQYPGFAVVYSVTLGNPLAVQYAMVNGAKPRRWPNPQRVRTPDGRLIPAAGYARGAIALQKSISLYFGKAAGANTGLMTNICAFTPGCLMGPWAEFAELEGKWAGESGWIEVVAGPVFSSPPTVVGGIVVPSAFYRVYRRGYGDTLAFLIPQTATSTKLESYLTSISAIEAATGVSIFANTVGQDQRDQPAKAVWQ
jgi:DNA/RNA endonuclease G (NUC1)